MSTSLKISLGAGLLISAVALFFVLTPRSPEAQLESAAQDYVRLALALDTINAGEVDSYTGPENLRPAMADSIAAINAQAQALRAEVATIAAPADSRRQQRLLRRIDQLVVITDYLADPGSLSFAQQAQTLYGLPLAELPEKTRLDERGRVEIVELPPTPEQIERDAILERLRELLPGTGSLPFRVASFQSRHLVPVNQREQVFTAALDACREATNEHLDLPAGERVEIEWTRDVSSPWHEYLGNGLSRIQINPLTIGYIGSMIDVACHEGYPGHHLQFLLRDSDPELGGVVEESVFLLRSPDAVFLEGAADFGVGLAMPSATRLQVERDVLFPLAGLSVEEIASYSEIHQLITALDIATVDTIQEFSDGQLPDAAAIVRLERDAMVASPRALLEFVREFGAYAVGYTLAERHIADFIEEAAAARGEDPWQLLRDLLTEPERVEDVFQ